MSSEALIPMVTLTDDEIRVIKSAAYAGLQEGAVTKSDEPVLATGLSKLKAMLRADAFAPNECKSGHHEWAEGKCKHCDRPEPQPKPTRPADSAEYFMSSGNAAFLRNELRTALEDQQRIGKPDTELTYSSGFRRGKAEAYQYAIQRLDRLLAWLDMDKNANPTLMGTHPNRPVVNGTAVRRAFEAFNIELKKHVEGKHLHVADWDECRDVYGSGFTAAWKAALESVFERPQREGANGVRE